MVEPDMWMAVWFGLVIKLRVIPDSLNRHSSFAWSNVSHLQSASQALLQPLELPEFKV
jgi:hypothetical protein